MSTCPTVGILLAAGAGRRFGGDKLLAPLHGRALVLHALAALHPAVDRVIAVVRPGAGALADALEQAGAQVVECPRATLGMGHSLACGADHAPPAARLLVSLGDMPAVRPDTIRRVRRALERGAVIVVPTHHGHRGHPVGFAPALQRELTRLVGDQGARALLQRHAADVREIAVDDPGILHDVDTPTDLSETTARALNPAPRAPTDR
ncbi:nucleotidyltransferase family protein [Immundisolibacter sp.]|uniref:nucleotidyltransferase family protein n=1 Tax=Immundisolibacter sp. TaxID=1934948 RepID=UPI003F856145